MIGSLIYNFFISPIECIFETFYVFAEFILHSEGCAIVALSIFVNFLVLPLYKRADKMQAAERDKQKAMKPWLDHIKKNFKGDERYMMTQAYYRQQNYKPIYALRGVLPLLLQIPFFIAAYHFLSNLTLLQGESFLFIKDLGVPDGLIVIGDTSINLLPILMTAINVISGIIYTKGFPIKEKLQLFGVAAIFLILLYNSPSGLVLYWTLNNVFSLCKNIIQKKTKRKSDATSASEFAHITVTKACDEEAETQKVLDSKIFYTSCAFLTVFLGLVIPLSVIVSSPTEFISTSYGPEYLLARTFLIFAGLFMLWFTIYYKLMRARGKNVLTYFTCALAFVSLVNYFFFLDQNSNMSANLVYTAEYDVTITTGIINLVVVAAIVSLTVFVLMKNQKIIKYVLACLVVASFALSIVNFVKCETVLGEYKEAQTEDGMEKIIPLSKNGKNVVVFMLDRAIGEYLPRILEEKPELKESLAGFTYYPNTVSYGAHTNISVPSLFGGYDYTPIEINKRVDESLQDKQNEALSVMPALFNDADYTVTVCDAPYAGTYTESIDLSIYDEYEHVTGHITEGAYLTQSDGEMTKYYEEAQQHNFVGYSVFATLPKMLGYYYYDFGNYASTIPTGGVSKSFYDSYTVMKNLANLTSIEEDGNTFLMIDNNIAHNPVNLTIPSYEPSIDATEFRDFMNADYNYMVNMAAIMKLADWFDYMREQGVYDNTKIIVCSDHSFNIEDSKLNFIAFNMSRFNPLYMVKDYGETEFKTNDTFMTTADTSYIALEGEVEDATNPFTGNEISKERADQIKNERGAIIFNSTAFDTTIYNGNLLGEEDDKWFRVTDNIFDPSNWSTLKDEHVEKLLNEK